MASVYTPFRNPKELDEMIKAEMKKNKKTFPSKTAVIIEALKKYFKIKQLS